MATTITGAQARITAEVGSWPGITVGSHQFGGVQYQLGRREIGHMHGDYVADLPFPRRVRDELIAAGRADYHHALPDSGWVTFRIRGEDDVASAIELFRLGYERATKARR
jgi:Family of unknown function (DUF5519)